MEVSPCVLSGVEVRLEPLQLEHVDGLCRAGLFEDLWRWTSIRIGTADDMRRYVEDALEERRSGIALPFATVLQSSGEVVGSTRFGSIDKRHRRMEIGWTWITPAHQRTPVNTEAKYLMLRHAFESLGCIRVELKTNSRNERSRRAILRIGATEEGIFRNHMINADGSVRHTVYYSIIDSEWPAVKQRLEAMLQLPSERSA